MGLAERSTACADFPIRRAGFKTALKDIDTQPSTRRALADAVMEFCARTKPVREIRALGFIYSETEPLASSLEVDQGPSGLLYVVPLLEGLDASKGVPGKIGEVQRWIWRNLPEAAIDFLPVLVDELPDGATLGDRFNLFVKHSLSGIPGAKTLPIVDRRAA